MHIINAAAAGRPGDLDLCPDRNILLFSSLINWLFFPLFCRRFRQQKDLVRLRERQFRLKQHYVEIVQILGL